MFFVAVKLLQMFKYFSEGMNILKAEVTSQKSLYSCKWESVKMY